MQRLRMLAMGILIAMSALMLLRDQLPATAEEVHAVRQKAGGSLSAERVLRDELSDNPSPSKGELRQIKERVEEGLKPPARASEQRGAMQIERQRLAGMSWRAMSVNDMAKLVLLEIAEHVALVLGVIALAAGLGIRRYAMPRPTSQS